MADRPHDDGVADDGARTLLVVDDEPDIVELMEIFMEESLPHVAVIGAYSGREGLQRLAQHDVDLILSDFRMPGMDGVEFLSEARRMRPEVPRILYTAYDDPMIEQRARQEAGAQGVWSKDLAAEDLVVKIQEILLDHPLPGRSNRAAYEADQPAGTRTTALVP